MILTLIVMAAALLQGCAGSPGVLPESPANAYLAIIEDLYEKVDPPEDLRYVAFDLSLLDAEMKDTVIRLAKAFCKARGKVFLEGTLDELVRKGYVTGFVFENGEIRAQLFPEGIHVTLEPISATDAEIVCDATSWRGDLSAEGMTYTAAFVDGSWQIGTSDYWIS